MKPSRLLLSLLAALLALAIVLGSLPLLKVKLPETLQPLWWGLLLALLLLAAVDALWLRRLPSPRLQRQLPGNLPLGRWSEVQLTLHHDYRQPLSIELFDHVPERMDFEYLPQRVELRPGEQTQCGYRVRPLLRCGRVESPSNRGAACVSGSSSTLPAMCRRTSSSASRSPSCR